MLSSAIGGYVRFHAEIGKIKPIIPKEEKSLRWVNTIQTPKQLAQYKQFSQCINCGLCYAACPQYALKPEFLGPAAIALLYRYNEDSRDGAKEENETHTPKEAGVWSCTFVGFLF